MSKRKDRPAFTLRFEDENTHEALRRVARHMGLSMNELAQGMLARELRVAVLALETDLSETLQAVRAYRGKGVKEDLESFAEAEASEEDPVETRLASMMMNDALGVSRVFA